MLSAKLSMQYWDAKVQALPVPMQSVSKVNVARLVSGMEPRGNHFIDSSCSGI